MSANGNKPPEAIKDLGGLYLFSYERYISFFDLLENPDAMREQVVMEVMEQWNATVAAMDERMQRRMAAKAATEPAAEPLTKQLTRS